MSWETQLARAAREFALCYLSCSFIRVHSWCGKLPENQALTYLPILGIKMLRIPYFPRRQKLSIAVHLTCSGYADYVPTGHSCNTCCATHPTRSAGVKHTVCAQMTCTKPAQRHSVCNLHVQWFVCPGFLLPGSCYPSWTPQYLRNSGWTAKSVILNKQ